MGVPFKGQRNIEKLFAEEGQNALKTLESLSSCRKYSDLLVTWKTSEATLKTVLSI